MAIKSKSKFKLIGWLLLLAFGLSGTLLGLNRGIDFVGKSYFETREFETQLSQYIGYLNVFELNSVTKEEAKENIIVTKEEIEEHRYRYGDLSEQIANINEQYKSKIEEAIRNNNTEVAKTLTSERDMKIEDITNNFKSDDYVQAKVIKEKEEKIDKFYNSLHSYREDFEHNNIVFRYYLKDVSTENVYTNLDLTKGKANEYKAEMLSVREYSNERYGYLDSYIYNDIEGYNEIVGSVVKKRGPFEGWIGVSNTATNAWVLNNYKDFQQKQLFFYIYTILGVICLSVALYLNGKFKLNQYFSNMEIKAAFNQMFLDLRVTLFVVTLFLSFPSLFFVMERALYFYHGLYDHFVQMVFSLLIATFFISATYIQGIFLIDRFKDRGKLQLDFRESLFWRLKDAFLIRSIGFKVLLLLGVFFAAGIGFTVILLRAEALVIYLPLFIVVVIPTLVLLANSIGYLNRIINHTQELAKGNLEPDLPIRGKSVFANFAQNVNTLKHGVKESLSEQAKSERLKTELITNVSHDLRTPLTSIINYAELLKTPDLTEEDRDAYIQIINRKSRRLKVLIDDLFEASKMVSGSVELVKQKVDLVQLLQQALAEHTEAIAESNLQFRVTKPDSPVYATVDGQKLWRVFDNLIGNILKYSLENTRVYISIKALQNKVELTFKNVTRYELGENTEELFERFKRGDTSRHTEGSGLGLAIAKSIVDLHGGSLDIEVDGDLFKVTVVIFS